MEDCSSVQNEQTKTLARNTSKASGPICQTLGADAYRTAVAPVYCRQPPPCRWRHVKWLMLPTNTARMHEYVIGCAHSTRVESHPTNESNQLSGTSIRTRSIRAAVAARHNFIFFRTKVNASTHVGSGAGNRAHSPLALSPSWLCDRSTPWARRRVAVGRTGSACRKP